MDQAAHPFFWFRTPVWWITAAFYLLLGGVLAGLPLTNYLGLEFSLVVGIVAGFLAGPLAIGYFHRRLPTTDPAAARLAAWEIGPTRLWIEASLWHLSALAFALVGLLVRFFLTEPCAPGRGMGFFLLLPVVSVFYAGAWGLACGSLLLRPRTAKIIVTLIALGTLVGTGLNFLKKPTVYVYNPFFGHFPGPIYDEAATPHLALIAYRLANLAEAWLIVVTLLLFFWRTWVTPRPRPGVLPWFLFIALAATSMSIHQARFDLGFDMTTERLVDKLGGHKATPPFRHLLSEKARDRTAHRPHRPRSRISFPANRANPRLFLPAPDQQFYLPQRRGEEKVDRRRRHRLRRLSQPSHARKLGRRIPAGHPASRIGPRDAQRLRPAGPRLLAENHHHRRHRRLPGRSDALGHRPWTPGPPG